jgi:N utilization substance protein B
MPLFQRSADGSTALARVHQGGQEVTYRLSREGTLFLTEILGIRDGDEFRPTDLQLLVDRGWAEPAGPGPEVEVAPEPNPTPARPAAPTSAARPRAESARHGQARRRRGREVALQVLYWLEQYPEANPEDVKQFILRRLGDQKLAEFARGLVEGVRSRQALLDERISEVAENWRIDRMAVIDRNILRLGAFEMLQGPDLPRRIAINEALELAKRYSTAQSSRFVNGVLDRLHIAEPDGPNEPPEGPQTTGPDEDEDRERDE